MASMSSQDDRSGRLSPLRVTPFAAAPSPAAASSPWQEAIDEAQSLLSPMASATIGRMLSVKAPPQPDSNADAPLDDGPGWAAVAQEAST
jgi:hypothetical protein